VGRNQGSEQEALLFDQKVQSLLKGYQVSYREIVGGEPAVKSILADIGLC
jgi:hypothetical protein